MEKIITVDFKRPTVAAAPESEVSPESLLPLLRRVKNLSAENYAFIVKTLCIYGHENAANLIGR